MSITLRGHHLLCVHGFRGMGYSPKFAVKMGEIVEQIRDDYIDFPITVVADFDETCHFCPNKGETICEASEDSNEHVLSMDTAVIRRLGLTAGEEYSKSQLVQLTAERVKPNDIDVICEGCSWLSYGVCKEGLSILREKMGLG